MAKPGRLGKDDPIMARRSYGLGRVESLLLSLALLGLGFAGNVVSAAPAGATPNRVVTPAAPAAPPAVNLSKTGPSNALPGEPVTYTLNASNPTAANGGVIQYNISFRDVLPPGVTYVSGSTQPTYAGEPTIVTDPVTGAQTLIWDNVFDLPAGASNSISFQVVADTTDFPVNSTFSDTASAYGSTAPRTVPSFDANGNPISDPNVIASAPDSASTTVAAVDVTKDEPSPEAKMLRGVHDHTTVYTLTITNGDAATTRNATVTDFIPAGMEFLGCGGVDNSTTGVEYPGAPSLSATPAVGANCLTPASVDTVAAPARLPSGVYTEVTWNIGNLAPGQTVTIRYAAGIPLHENTLVFLGGKPSPASLGQEANLDNNLGHTTRQNGTAVGLTNHVEVTGTYTGAVDPGSSQDVDVLASHTVTVNDLRIIKSVTPADFEGGNIATYTLHIAASEYTDSSDIVVTDTIPNGICPLDTTTNYVTGSPSDCDPGSVAPSVPYQSVTQNANGTFTVVFDPISLPHNGTTTITYQARMRTVYTGGARAGLPTAEGDSFTNTAGFTATTSPRTDTTTGESGTSTIQDQSSVTQSSGNISFGKEMQPRAVPQDCSANTYQTPDALTPAQSTFQKGDRICFEIDVQFPQFNSTVNPVITDFLPLNTDYEAGSETLGPANTVPAGQVNFDSSSAANGVMSWTLGAQQSNGELTVGPNKTFQVRFSVIVAKASPGKVAVAFDNIAKARAQTTDGTIRAARSSVPFLVAPAPAVAITKGVQSVNGLPAGGNGPNVDHVQVKEGDVVVFRVDVSNPASSTTSVHTVKTWDVLAPGITCAAVSAISNGGVCTNPGAAGQPSFVGNDTLSAIVWNRPASEVVAPGASVTYTYAVTIPTGQSVGTDLVDTASVRSFDADTNLPGTTTYFPANNVDTTVPVASQDAPAASDSSDVFIAPVGLTKSVLSAINEAGNVGGETPPGGPSTQATIGEQVSYTVTATLPAHATVYNGVLKDPMPTGLVLVSSSAVGLPAGATFDPATATVTLPAVLDNTSGSPITITVTIVARVTTLAANTAGTTRTNTATFTSNASAGGSAIAPVNASSQVNIVEPSPSITKSANPTSVVGGQTVTYTLSASNGSSASVLHDAWVADCLPTGLTFNAYGTPTQGSTVAPVAGAGTPCAAGTTQLAWNVGDIAPGKTAKLTFTAVVTPAATGLQKFVNTAVLTGDSIAGARTGPTDPGAVNGRLYTKNVSNTIQVLGAAVTKSVTPSTATIGQPVTYTVIGVLQPNVTYFNATGVDTLPAGLDPSTIAVQSVTCITTAGDSCSPTNAIILPQAPSGTSTKVGLYFGNVGNVPVGRIFTVVYTVNVADVAAAKAGVALTNSVHVSWNNTDKGTPANAGATFDQSTSSASATFTVVEPSMSITKSVDDSTVEPGQVFHYTVTAVNANTANTSAAYNVAVKDTAIPSGVVVDPTSISDGGVLSGADPVTGSGGTITWLLPGPIAPGGSEPLTFAATLAPSSGLTTAPQVNTADVTGYDSLPSGGRHYPATPSASATVTPQFPHVTAAKTTPNGTTAFVGESFTWQVTLHNTGTGTAFHVGATDTLPPNWNYDDDSAQISVNGAAAQQVEPVIDPVTGVLTWSGLADLAPGGSLTITYTATPTEDVAQSPGIGLSVNQTNTVQPAAVDATGAPGNASGSYAGPPATAVAHIANADLQLVKTVGTAPIAGGSGSWTVVVTNNGPDAAAQVTVTDGFNNPAPTGVSNISASGTGWTCTSAAPMVCTRTNPNETLANGASFPPITVHYDVASDIARGHIYANAATVSAHTFDTNLDNNTDNARTTVSTRADLAITKKLTSPEMIAGEPATYTVSVTNLGPSVSAGPFTITDTLPPTSTFVSVSGAGWECDPVAPGTIGATLTCSHIADLAVGADTRDLTVTVGIPAGQTAAVVNTATVSDTTTPDPNPDNDTATVTTTPDTSADLQIQKQHDGTFTAGDQASYTLTVVNHGPSDAADATITDTLPASLSFLPSSGDGWTCSASGQDVTCSHPASIPAAPDPGATTSVTLNVQVASGAMPPIVNEATVSSTTHDPDLTNNTDGDRSDVNLSADLAISKSHSGDAVAGDPLSYTLGVSNNGPSDVASPITVTDPLPAGLTYVSASGTGWDCSYDSGTRLVTCTLAAGLTAHTDAPDITLNVTVDPDAGPSTITNTANVTSKVDDPDLDNNHAKDPTVVGVDTDVSLTKTLDTPTPVLAGTNVTFTLQASNAGPSDAADVVVTDPLPDHLAYVSATGDGWECNPSGSDFICSRATVPAVPPGDPVPAITLVAQVDPGIPLDADGNATVINTASISTSSPGTIHNPDPVPVPVVARADLALTKTQSVDSPIAGTTFTWTLTAHNNGPSDAAAPLTVTDTLPAYETYVSAADPWSCTAGPPPLQPTDTQDVSCTLNAGLAVGADAPALHITVQLSADAPSGKQTNTATVTSGTPGDPGTGTGTITVARHAKLGITKTHSGHGVVGQPMDFHIGVHNAGPSTADQVVVTDPLPTGLTYVSATGTDWTCHAKHDDVTCLLAGTLASGADAPPITLTVTVHAAAYPSVTNVATVSSTDPDLPGTAQASDTLTVDPDAALKVTKQHVGRFVVGQQGSYLITVKNLGPTASPGPIKLTDPLPAGLEYVSATGTGWTCSATGRLVSCRHANGLALHETTDLTVVVLVGPAALPSVTNVATATGPGSPQSSGSDNAPVTPAAGPGSQNGGGSLPFTGFAAAGLLLAALALLGFGGFGVLLGRPRRR
jgi:large repetitive protein